MKQQVARLSPHQNAKVLAVLVSTMALVALLPVAAIAMAYGAPMTLDPTLLLVAAVAYVLLNYALTAAGCLLYNGLARVVGGLEFEARGGAET